MASKTTSWNRYQNHLVVLEHAHDRAARLARRETHAASLNPLPQPDKGLQERLVDLLRSPEVSLVESFGMCALDIRATELRHGLQVLSRCVKGRWNVAICHDVDGNGTPGWQFQRIR